MHFWRKNKITKKNRKSKKKLGCKSFLEFSVQKIDKNYYITFKNANWIHNHPVNNIFLESFGIISKKRIKEIIELSKSGLNANEIRMKEGMGSIPSQNLYDVRGKVV